MNNKALTIYLAILTILCAAVITGAKMMGQQGAYLAQVYMLTPAFAAILTRLLWYPPHFKDANLRIGRFKDYIKFWAWALGMMAFSYGLRTLLGAIRWDFTGQIFLDSLARQFAASGQDISTTIPSGFTPQMMLILYVAGALTVFNIPGLITGFGEEFGHRGFMFPLLYKIRPWIGFVIGGLIWYAWHLPLLLVLPQTTSAPLWETALTHLTSAAGSVFTFTYLAYVYVKSESVFVTALAHIAMNNVGTALSYFALTQNQLLANFGLVSAMGIIVAILYFTKELDIFARYFVDKRPMRDEARVTLLQSKHNRFAGDES